jgi:IS30 family transposase
MMFRKEHGKVNVTSLVERVSRHTVVMRNEDRTSRPIMETLINGLAPLPAAQMPASRSLSTVARSSQPRSD